ncbi:heme/hemin ABC transporter substrate-binding protein [Congregibacter litoralis]|uniref:ABC-type hemin transport system, periplasmic component n=1 Tax=Congregibacter litoralis KT71 TaxID=314285 RepID=A4A518_9GAMM|nr:ABC transporter substrate-binding protein [Congregibacter litoralis]EAQ98889.1 ABC-type hemin transport system, periplasmic component [Congregibacter litoralis KT71]
MPDIASPFFARSRELSRSLFCRSTALTLPIAVMTLLLLPVTAYAEASTQRVTSTDAAITEIVVALGALDRLVAVDDTSDLPPEGAILPRLGYHRALSAEGLLAQRADLVLASEHAGPERALAPLAAASVALVRLPVAHSVDGLKANIRVISEALDLQEAGRQLLAQIDQQAAVISRHSSLSARRAVLLRESNGELRVAGEGSAGNALLQLLGANNAVDYNGYRTFTAEGLLALNPEVLLIADETLPAAAQWLSGYPLLRYSQAARDQAVVSVDSRALVGGLSLKALSEAERILRATTAPQQVSHP